MSRIRSNILWTFLAVSALDGALTAWLGADTAMQIRKNLLMAMVQMGLIQAGMRLPLAPLGAEYHDTVKAALRESGVLQ